MDLLIMNHDDISARYENGNFVVTDKKKLPLYLSRTQNIERWLEIRAIDEHRPNSRLLKKALRLTEKDDISTAIRVNAATITDSYWVKTPGSTLTYADIRFDNDYFSNLALRGDYNSFNRTMNSDKDKTPELTNTGSFEKCWKLQNGEWWMYKKANQHEMFSELFAYELGISLDFHMAEYRRGMHYIKTKDFTNHASVNFEPAYSFMDDNDDYIDTLKILDTLAPHIIPDYIKMIFLDTLIANPDRHTFNFGILRDKKGAILSLSPNFDNNMALIARGYPHSTTRKNDALARLFNVALSQNEDFLTFLPTISENMIWQVLKKLNMKVRSQFIVDFIMNGYKQIKRV